MENNNKTSVMWTRLVVWTSTIDRSILLAIRFADCGDVLKGLTPGALKQTMVFKLGFLAFGTTWSFSSSRRAPPAIFLVCIKYLMLGFIANLQQLET